jgi:hypothetical protein
MSISLEAVRLVADRLRDGVEIAALMVGTGTKHGNRRSPNNDPVIPRSIGVIRHPEVLDALRRAPQGDG